MRVPRRWHMVGIAGLAVAVLTAVQVRNVQRPPAADVGQAPDCRPVIALRDPVRMAVLGDSLGFGCGARNPQLGFTHRVFETIRASRPSATMQNFAMPHATTRQVLEHQLPLLAADATLVFLVAGSNDVKHYGRVKRFARDYSELVAGIRQKAPAALVVAAGLFDISLAPAVPHLARPAVAAFSAMSNAEIARIAQQHEAIFVDYFRFSLGIRERVASLICADGWHPTDEGHELLAREAMSVLGVLL